MQVQNLCFGCMEDDSGLPACPRCGYQSGQLPESPLYLPPGTILHDQYVVGRTLGHGGFGITYLSWDLNLERRVALKEYLPNGLATRTTGTLTVSTYSGQKASYDLGLQKFLEEARVLARFQSHPGMVAVQFFFQANGTAYLVMEYLDGMTFDAYLKEKGGRIPFPRAMDVLMPVMDALREVHKTGILHRDVSPDNIYITRLGPVKLLDFGAARYALGEHSQNFSIILKEGYAPEEQYRSKGRQGPWTDVYASAATLYRAIVGKVAPPALDRIHQDELEPPSSLGIALPPEAEAALLKGLAVDASSRYQSMEDFQQDIAPFRHALPDQEVRNLTVPLQASAIAARTVPFSGRNTQSASGTVPAPVIPIDTHEKWRSRFTPRRVLIGGAVVAAALVAFTAAHLLSAGRSASSIASAQQTEIPSSPPQTRPPASTTQTTPPPPQPVPPRSTAPPPRSYVQPTPRTSSPQPTPPPSTPQPTGSPVPQQFTPNPPVQPSAPPPAQPTYQALIAQAEGLLRQNNASYALQVEQQAVNLNPALPTAYDMLGYTWLYGYGNYAAARQNMNNSMQRGGFALFRVRHDRGDGTFSNSTVGMLRISSGSITYNSDDRSDSFAISRDSMEDAALNSQVGSAFRHFFGSAERAYSRQSGTLPAVRGAFHIRATARNYNLAGTSANPVAEAGMILGLLNR